MKRSTPNPNIQPVPIPEDTLELIHYFHTVWTTAKNTGNTNLLQAIWNNASLRHKLLSPRNENEKIALITLLTDFLITKNYNNNDLVTFANQFINAFPYELKQEVITTLGVDQMNKIKNIPKDKSPKNFIDLTEDEIDLTKEEERENINFFLNQSIPNQTNIDNADGNDIYSSLEADLFDIRAGTIDIDRLILNLEQKQREELDLLNKYMVQVETSQINSAYNFWNRETVPLESIVATKNMLLQIDQELKKVRDEINEINRSLEQQIQISQMFSLEEQQTREENQILYLSEGDLSNLISVLPEFINGLHSTSAALKNDAINLWNGNVPLRAYFKGQSLQSNVSSMTIDAEILKSVFNTAVHAGFEIAADIWKDNRLLQNAIKTEAVEWNWKQKQGLLKKIFAYQQKYEDFVKQFIQLIVSASKEHYYKMIQIKQLTKPQKRFIKTCIAESHPHLILSYQNTNLTNWSQTENPNQNTNDQQPAKRRKRSK